MTSTARKPRPVVHGLRALVDAHTALPATTTAMLAEGPLEYVKAGDGAPAVVLVSWAAMPIESWALVLPELAQSSTVLAYNARGLGASAAPQRPQTGAVVVDTLRALLAAAGVAPPYVLVGHSVGGLHVNLFARTFPHDVAGVVLLESNHPDDHLAERRLRFVPEALNPKGAKGKRRFEAIHFLAETAAEIERAGPFPDVPLAVVSGSRTPRRWATLPQWVRTHADRQLDLVTLSALGIHTSAPASGQYPQVTDPEIVVRAVRAVVAA